MCVEEWSDVLQCDGDRSAACYLSHLWRSQPRRSFDFNRMVVTPCARGRRCHPRELDRSRYYVPRLTTSLTDTTAGQCSWGKCVILTSCDYALRRNVQPSCWTSDSAIYSRRRTKINYKQPILPSLSFFLLSRLLCCRGPAVSTQIFGILFCLVLFTS